MRGESLSYAIPQTLPSKIQVRRKIAGTPALLEETLAFPLDLPQSSTQGQAKAKEGLRVEETEATAEKE